MNFLKEHRPFIVMMLMLVAFPLAFFLFFSLMRPLILGTPKPIEDAKIIEMCAKDNSPTTCKKIEKILKSD